MNRSGTMPPRVLCLGAHPDDLEIGCGGTILKLTEGEVPLDVTWIVFSGNEERRREATESANVFLGRAQRKEVLVKDFRDGFFPLILEYEIPKYDGDMGSPNAFVELDEPTVRQKIDTILKYF